MQSLGKFTLNPFQQQIHSFNCSLRFPFSTRQIWSNKRAAIESAALIGSNFSFFSLLYPSIVMEADDMSCQQKSNDGKRVEKVKVSSYKNINFEWVSQRQPNCMDLRTSRHQLMSFCAACWLPEASSFMAKIQRNETINREKAYGRGGACMSFRSFWWIH